MDFGLLDKDVLVQKFARFLKIFSKNWENFAIFSKKKSKIFPFLGV